MSSIREATLADAPPVLALNQAVDRETRFMLLEPDERRAGTQLIAASTRGRSPPDYSDWIDGHGTQTGPLFFGPRGTTTVPTITPDVIDTLCGPPQYWHQRIREPGGE
jgi:hypothetical protein